VAVTVIRGGIVVPMDENAPRVLYGADVVVKDDRIAYVGKPPADTPVEDVMVHDAGGSIVFPGFTNAHTHASMTLLRGYAHDVGLREWLEERVWPIEGRMTEEDIYWGSVLACAEMIRSGITAFCDMYFKMAAVAGAVRDTGMRAVISQGLVGLTSEDRLRTLRALTPRTPARWIS